MRRGHGLPAAKSEIHQTLATEQEEVGVSEWLAVGQHDEVTAHRGTLLCRHP